MAPLKKHLTALSKKGQIIKHAGKGSAAGPSGGWPNSNPAASSINDYAKATPMANPAPSPMGSVLDTDSDGA